MVESNQEIAEREAKAKQAALLEEAKQNKVKAEEEINYTFEEDLGQDGEL